MGKRILASALLSFLIPVAVFADTAVEDSKKKETQDFLDESWDDDIDYKVQPQIYVSFYPRYGVNFISSDKEEDKKDFSVLNSRSAGATLAINIPIKSSSFFYAFACDISSRTFHWQNFKNFYSQSLWFGESENKKDINDKFQEDFKNDVKFSRLNFWNLDIMFQLGVKSDILDHREGFFAKGMFGVGFQFNESVDNKKTDFLVETKTDDYVPLRNIKFLWGLEMGYWRVGLNCTGVCTSLFKKEEENYKGLKLDVSRGIIPFSLSIFFDVF
ncbi:MAG: hypothetical protein LBD32_00695 [Cytophagales bacterium]|jgi:hypothetical protein|nr:hypothetical protein [Cytophagales bacterium]